LIFIFAFRGGKYWQFDNKPKLKKPLGNLIEGGSLAKNKWPGIHFSGAIGNKSDNFIIVYKDKWIQWLPNGKIDIEEGSIEEKVIEITDEQKIKFEHKICIKLFLSLNLNPNHKFSKNLINQSDIYWI
jgi:hypothetical protein